MNRSKIFIAEDDPDILTMSVDFFERKGHKVFFEKTIDSARKTLQTGGPDFDVIVLDLSLDNEYCFSLIRSGRELAPYARIILISGEPGIERDVRKLLRENVVDGFLAKPFGLRELLSEVEKPNYGRTDLKSTELMGEANTISSFKRV